MLKVAQSLRFLNNYFTRACYMSRPSYPSWFNDPNNIRRWVEILKLHIM
jgi:hypothetical protein